MGQTMTQAKRNISRHRQKPAPRRAAFTGAAAKRGRLPPIPPKMVFKMVGWANAELKHAFDLVEEVFNRPGEALPRVMQHAVFRELSIDLRASRDQLALILERNGS